MFLQQKALRDFEVLRGEVASALHRFDGPLSVSRLTLVEKAEDYTELESAIHTMVAYLDGHKLQRGVRPLIAQLGEFRAQVSAGLRAMEDDVLVVDRTASLVQQFDEQKAAVLQAIEEAGIGFDEEVMESVRFARIPTQLLSGLVSVGYSLHDSDIEGPFALNVLKDRIAECKKRLAMLREQMEAAAMDVDLTEVV